MTITELAVVVHFKAAAHGVVRDGKSIDDTYYIGETLEIPDYVFSNGVENKTASSSLILPDGNVISTKSLFIKTAGEYTLKYNAVIGGKRYTESFVFYVNDPLYEIKGENGSVAYWGDSGYGEGVIATLELGDVFHYNKVINLEDLETDNFIKLYNVPHTT